MSTDEARRQEQIRAYTSRRDEANRSAIRALRYFITFMILGGIFAVPTVIMVSLYLIKVIPTLPIVQIFLTYVSPILSFCFFFLGFFYYNSYKNHLQTVKTWESYYN